MNHDVVKLAERTVYPFWYATDDRSEITERLVVMTYNGWSYVSRGGVIYHAKQLRNKKMGTSEASFAIGKKVTSRTILHALRNNPRDVEVRS